MSSHRREKLRRGIDLRHEGGDGLPPRFLDYSGGCDPEHAKRYLLGKFMELARRDRMVSLPVRLCAIKKYFPFEWCVTIFLLLDDAPLCASSVSFCQIAQPHQISHLPFNDQSIDPLYCRSTTT